MEKFKKLCTILLLVCVTVFVLCACKSSSTNSHTNSQTADTSDDGTVHSADTVTNDDTDIVTDDGTDITTDDDTDITTDDDTDIVTNIAVLTGPTGMGFIKAWDDSDKGLSRHQYNVTAYSTADEITAGIVKGTIDVAAVPCNLASVLYNKTEGGISVAAVNTLGVLYMVSTGDTITSIQDVKGKTIYTTGQGTTPEYTLNYILSKNGLEPGKDVTIEYKSEASEVAALMSSTENTIAMLPQPFVTTVLMNNENASIALNMTEEWKKIDDSCELVTGVVIVRKEYLQKHEELFRDFLTEYKNSTSFVNGNVDEAAAMIEDHNLFKAAVAKKAIPFCNIVFLTGKDMERAISGYLRVLFEANSQSVGGRLPDDNFYYSGQ